MNDGMALEITTGQAAEYLQLANATDKTLSEVYSSFREMLKATAEHPFRSTLTLPLEELLTYLEALPKVDCDLLPVEAREVVKGWLIHNGVMLAFVSSYYEVMSAEA
jgi:hypothetical protein